MISVRVLKSVKSEKAIKEGYKDALDEIMKELKTKTIAYAPERTGDLKRSVDTEVHGTRGILTVDMNYAGFQEFGTMYMEAANMGIGYVRPAVKKVEGQISRIVGNAIRKAFRRL